jgi:hypothetical protein
MQHVNCMKITFQLIRIYKHMPTANHETILTQQQRQHAADLKPVRQKRRRLYNINWLNLYKQSAAPLSLSQAALNSLSLSLSLSLAYSIQQTLSLVTL